MTTITMKSMLEAGVHFGHQTRQWNPKMSKFIYCERNKIHIIDLQKTVKELKKAYKFIRDTAAENKAILFVGTKKQAADVLEQESKRCGAFYVSERWLGGTLTNFQTIRKSVGRLRELERMKEEGIFKLLSKKERSRRQKEMDRLELSLRGIKNMENLPGALFIIDPVEEEVAVLESKKASIPIVAVCDTNSNPEAIDYPIPGNDDAIRAVSLFCSIMADAVKEGKEAAERRQTKDLQEAATEIKLTEEDMSKEIKFEETVNEEPEDKK